jgi:DNA-binding CsgD family transcriptional regulator
MRWSSSGVDSIRRSAAGRLTRDVVNLYKVAVTNQPREATEIMAKIGMDHDRLGGAMRVLKDLRLIRPSPDPQRVWDAVSPECALADLLAEDEAELQRRQAELARVRCELLSLVPTYLEARRAMGAADTIELVDDVPTVRQLLAHWSCRVKKEVRIAHPGSGFSEVALARSMKLDLPVIKRGIRFRGLLQHAVRHHEPTRYYAQTVVSNGAEIRTVSMVPRRMIIFDNEIAFIPQEGGPENGAALIRDAAVVDYLIALFDLLWAVGRPFPDDSADGEDQIRGDVRQIIVQLLSTGVKDEVIARRLGLSVRTCRRHIAALMEELGAESRFQAGFIAHQRGLLQDV